MGTGTTGMTEEKLDNVIIFLQAVAAPARLAGEILLVHGPWTRTRRTVVPRSTIRDGGVCDARPTWRLTTRVTASDGLATSDQFDMMNSSPERYNWELKGKKRSWCPTTAISCTATS